MIDWIAAVTHLEINSSRKDANQSADTIDSHECQTVFVNTQHHLQATTYGLDVLVTLLNKLEIF